jgi:hypothetical protein
MVLLERLDYEPARRAAHCGDGAGWRQKADDCPEGRPTTCAAIIFCAVGIFSLLLRAFSLLFSRCCFLRRCCVLLHPSDTLLPFSGVDRACVIALQRLGCGPNSPFAWSTHRPTRRQTRRTARRPQRHAPSCQQQDGTHDLGVSSSHRSAGAAFRAV